MKCKFNCDINHVNAPKTLVTELQSLLIDALNWLQTRACEVSSIDA